jgi:drug/metabolite transporter (DMT)-like permease
MKVERANFARVTMAGANLLSRTEFSKQRQSKNRPNLKETQRVLRVPILASLAMIAFAANSVLARLALGDRGIDPGTFTLLRLLAGASVLVFIVRLSPTKDRHNLRAVGSWSSATLLLTYAATFSYAYVNLGAATGALTLFAVVQTVMFTAAVRSGERPGIAGFTGLALALAGLVALVGPGVSRPDPMGALLMSVAGVAWAGYTLRGRRSDRPVLVTAGNFLRSVPLALALWMPMLLLHREAVHVGAKGVVLAVISGAVASGLGYALWYTVLPWLTRAQSGIVQMAPAPLATLGGLAVLGEPITAKLLLASFLILSGVLIGVLRPRKNARD